jgi:hypothetical protein
LVIECIKAGASIIKTDNPGNNVMSLAQKRLDYLNNLKNNSYCYKSIANDLYDIFEQYIKDCEELIKFLEHFFPDQKRATGSDCVIL